MSELQVPGAFAAWVKTLPDAARKRLSIHDLRQIWEPMRWRDAETEPPEHLGWHLLCKPGECPPRPFFWSAGQWWTDASPGAVAIDAAGLVYIPCPIPAEDTEVNDGEAD